MNFIKILTAGIIILISACFGCSKSEVASAPGPFGVTVYLRGSFNQWGLETPFMYTDQGYIASLELDAGKHQFKIADETWKQVDLGLELDNKFSLNQSIPLIAKSRNVNLEINTKDSYLFKLIVDENSDAKLLVYNGKIAL